jgi:hypothetical protein
MPKKRNVYKGKIWGQVRGQTPDLSPKNKKPSEVEFVRLSKTLYIWLFLKNIIYRLDVAMIPAIIQIRTDVYAELGIALYIVILRQEPIKE